MEICGGYSKLPEHRHFGLTTETYYKLVNEMAGATNYWQS